MDKRRKSNELEEFGASQLSKSNKNFNLDNYISEPIAVANGIEELDGSVKSSGGDDSRDLENILRIPGSSGPISESPAEAEGQLTKSTQIQGAQDSQERLRNARIDLLRAKTEKIDQELCSKNSKNLYSSLFSQAARICVSATMICITLGITYRVVGFTNSLCEKIQDELTRKACHIASVGLGFLLSGIGFFSIAKVHHLDKKLFDTPQEPVIRHQVS